MPFAEVHESGIWPVPDLSSEDRNVCFLKVTRTKPCEPPKTAVDPMRTYA